MRILLAICAAILMTCGAIIATELFWVGFVVLLIGVALASTVWND